MASTDLNKAQYVKLTSSTVVHGQIADRVYFVTADSTATRPYDVYILVSDDGNPRTFGKEHGGSARYQHTVYSTSRYTAINAAVAVRNALHHYQGSMDGVTVHLCRCSRPVVSRDPDLPIYAARFDAVFDYEI
jgi:hypothetical protein